MEALTTTAVNTAQPKARVCPPLAPELKEQFIAYFMQRYPLTRKIKIKRRHERYYARVLYRGEHPRRTFWAVAKSYEMLVMKTEMNYSFFRGVPAATNY